MKFVSISICLFGVTAFNFLYAQIDTTEVLDKVNLDPDFYEPFGDKPPCGIPCGWIVDEYGNFVDCKSPCCNCRDLYKRYNFFSNYKRRDTIVHDQLKSPIQR